jgi:hypothetical protein
VAMAPDGRMAVSGGADTSLIVWDISGLSPAGKLPAMNLGPNELQTFWTDLSAEDIPRGNRALWNLVAGAKDSVPSLDKSVFLLDPDHLNKLLKDLDDKVYRVRENASVELGKYGRWIEGTLRLELKKTLTEEVRRRVDKLLQKLAVPGSQTLEQERLRYRRTMLALEQIGTKEARAILQKMSRGGPEAPLREEAQASLERLGKRPAP